MKREEACMELKVFTLPTCKDCPAAKRISKEIADKYGLEYAEVDISTPEGQLEGLMYQIMSTPSIVIDKEVVARGKLPSREELETEIRKLLGR
jgi:thioredoxin 1